MSRFNHIVIDGLRFRRVNLEYSWDRKHAYVSEAPKGKRCDALICCRCTAVLGDNSEATRHVCVPFVWQSGEAGHVDYVPSGEYPIDVRERVRAVNHAPIASLWPHNAKPLDVRRIPPLSERYEALAMLLMEFSKMESEIERSRALLKLAGARRPARRVGWNRVEEAS